MIAAKIFAKKFSRCTETETQDCNSIGQIEMFSDTVWISCIKSPVHRQAVRTPNSWNYYLLLSLKLLRVRLRQPCGKYKCSTSQQICIQIASRLLTYCNYIIRTLRLNVFCSHKHNLHSFVACGWFLFTVSVFLFGNKSGLFSKTQVVTLLPSKQLGVYTCTNGRSRFHYLQRWLGPWRTRLCLIWRRCIEGGPKTVSQISNHR